MQCKNRWGNYLVLAPVARTDTTLMETSSASCRCRERSQFADALEEFLNIERLGQMVIGPDPSAPVKILSLCPHSEQHHRYRALGLNPLAERPAINVRKIDITHHNVWMVGVELLKGFPSVAGSKHPKPLAPQDQIDKLDDIVIVVNK